MNGARAPRRPGRWPALAASLLLLPVSAMAIDLAPLWDFSRPDVSEQRLRAALETARGDDALVLQTQIARSWGLRREFARAREILAAVEPQLAGAGFEPRTRWWLEQGRTHASATHRSDELTPEAREKARTAWTRALALAREGRLDGLAIDAIHMFAFIDTAPAEQLDWGRQALAVSLASSQPAAKAWEASIRNNIGYALHQLGRYDEALAEFERALALRERSGNAGSIRVARWMVAYTYRAQKRYDEALAIQHRLEAELQAAGETDPYVWEELELLYRAQGDTGRAERYTALRAARPK